MMEEVSRDPVKAYFISKENWQKKKNELKEKFPCLADSDVEMDENKIVEMIGILKSKTGNTKKRLHKLINRI